jgi:hypothetical protein
MPEPTTTLKTAPSSAVVEVLPDDPARPAMDRAGRIGARWTSLGGRSKLGHTAVVKVQVIDMSPRRSRLDAITHLSKGPSHV